MSLTKQSMETKSAILSELKEISPTVAAVGSGLTYRVPDGYFDVLAAAILNRIRTEGLSAKEELNTLSPLLGGLSKKSPYQVPEGYFESSPLLMQLRNKETYSVPEGYFDNLATNVLNKVHDRKPAKVISMNTSRRFMRYAAAAVVAGVMAVAGWFYFANNSSQGISDPVIAGVDGLSEDNKISDEEISKYLEAETIPVATAVIFPENDEMSASDIKEMLSDVSDDELQQYLTIL